MRYWLGCRWKQLSKKDEINFLPRMGSRFNIWKYAIRTTLERAKNNTKDFVVLVAAKLGDVRLIDSVICR